MTKDIEWTLELARRSMVPRGETHDVTEFGKSKRISVERLGVGPIVTPFGSFHQFEFRLSDEWSKYTVIFKGEVDDNLQPKFAEHDFISLRIDSGCETGQLFHDQTCECREQLHLAMKELSAGAVGLIVHIPRQDGRGRGLPFKLATLSLQESLGLDTVQASTLLDPGGFRDTRTYAGVPAILRFLGVPAELPIKLFTNNPKKAEVFSENGYVHVSMSPVIIAPTAHTYRHLEAKQLHLGHKDLVKDQVQSEDEIQTGEFGLRTNRTRHRLENLPFRSLCCGVDPILDRIPVEFDCANEESILKFLKETINILAPHVACYKLQVAFFHLLPGGHSLMAETISHIRETSPQSLVIVDAKVGDVEHTMLAHIDYYLKRTGADMLMVNPFMGGEPWRMVCEAGYGAVVLSKTSGNTSQTFQDLVLQSGETLWERVLSTVVEAWKQGYPVLPVLSSLSEGILSAKAMLQESKCPALLAGFGSQGGTALAVNSTLHDVGKLVFASSRALLFPYEREDTNWRSKVESAGLSLSQAVQECV